ncbi:MAG TPA: hypothetical protein VMH48_01575 [Methylomirabilota bacterium]|nr:hypothetical protein [Methylomirabilota bacterium]
MTIPKAGRICLGLGFVVLLLAVVPIASPAHSATGHFEVYCDGVGFFLNRIEGAPAAGKLFLFLHIAFPPGAIYLPEEKWSDVFVYRNRCAADGKCEVIAHGKVWLDAGATPAAERVSGKYEIDLNGQHLEGRFVAKRHRYKHAPRICE